MTTGSVTWVDTGRGNGFLAAADSGGDVVVPASAIAFRSAEVRQAGEPDVGRGSQAASTWPL
ncbi:S1 domain-containing protein [Georgenia ruanii]|uniref:cold-shock protein n=1 Tax=Georgenia ruanii TaxID=348442 RepID=UPI00126416FE|nr:cold-shock protein [Georgenia ruanii]